MRFRRNPQFLPSLKAEARTRVKAGAEVIRLKAVELVEEPKSGEQWPGMPRRSSAEGESPASQSGELVASLMTSDTYEDANVVGCAVYTQLVKARMLEGGTATRAPRPFLYPALVESKDAVMYRIGGVNG